MRPAGAEPEAHGQRQPQASGPREAAGLTVVVARRAPIATGPLFVGVAADSPLAAQEEIELASVAGVWWVHGGDHGRAVRALTPRRADAEAAKAWTWRWRRNWRAVGNGLMLLRAASRAAGW